jgi:inner membrane protein involved in colicin E2 resistance
MTNVSQLSQLERDFENLKLKIENASISIEKIKKSREVTNVDIKPTTLEFTKGHFHHQETPKVLCR